MKVTKQYSGSSWLDYAVCTKCGEFKVQPESVWFSEHNTGYSTRLTQCPHCGKVIILEFIEDYGLDVNSDGRFYVYK